jgi:hypothetical protein
LPTNNQPNVNVSSGSVTNGIAIYNVLEYTSTYLANTYNTSHLGTDLNSLSTSLFLDIAKSSAAGSIAPIDIKDMPTSIQ